MLVVEAYISLGLSWIGVALAVWAFIDALSRPAAAFTAADKLNKAAWVAIPAVCGLVLFFVGFLTFLGLPAMVAVGVYLADVRPAVREIQQGGYRW